MQQDDKESFTDSLNRQGMYKYIKRKNGYRTIYLGFSEISCIKLNTTGVSNLFPKGAAYSLGHHKQ